MLECGTLGTKGNVQVVIPYLTENYGNTRDPPDEQIPMCTLKHFPYQKEHTIAWARDLFEEFFVSSIDILNNYSVTTSNNNVNIGQKIENYKKVLNRFSNFPVTKYDCIVWSLDIWHQLFHNNIQ